MYIEHSQSVRYFAHWYYFTICQVLDIIASHIFSNETCLNVQCQCFIFNILSKFEIWVGRNSLKLIVCAKYHEHWTMFEETTPSQNWRVFSETPCT